MFLANQDFCQEPVSSDSSTGLIWKTDTEPWPPLRLLQVGIVFSVQLTAFNLFYIKNSSYNLQAKLSGRGESCTSACMRHNLTCERTYFPEISSPDFFVKSGLSCGAVRTVPERQVNIELSSKRPNAKDLCHAPNYDTITGDCSILTDTLLFSCACKSPNDIKRLCPCRPYDHEQIALWDGYI